MRPESSYVDLWKCVGRYSHAPLLSAMRRSACDRHQFADYSRKVGLMFSNCDDAVRGSSGDGGNNREFLPPSPELRNVQLTWMATLRFGI